MIQRQAAVSIARINRFLRNEELNPDNVKRADYGGSHAVKVDDGTFAWSAHDEPALKK